MRRWAVGGLTMLIALCGCIENSAPGNDREAHLDPPAPAAQWAPASSLTAVDAGLLKPQPLTVADLAALPPTTGRCLYRYTRVGLPVFVYPTGGSGAATVKLNGRLIPLAPTGPLAFAAGPIRVEIRHPEGPPTDELAEAQLVLHLRDARDELGFHGFATCR